MDIKEFQKECVDIVNKVDAKLKINHNSEVTVMHLIEEFGEVVRQVINPKLNRDNVNKENLGEEIADIILLTSKLADNYDINIEEAVKYKIKKLKQRHNL